MNHLKSRWGKRLDPQSILPEYPRPTLVRDSYFCLNGAWEYCINRSETVERYDGAILVPFSPETDLSGVQRLVTPQDILHYRKVFTLPPGFAGERVLLHFGAVDQECSVYLNGAPLGGHEGGYLDFCFDITAHLRPGENELTLRVKDRTEQSPHARGKQKLVRRGRLASLFYTPQSGIWKTVWMEAVPRRYIKRLEILPLFDRSAVQVTLRANVRRGTGTVRVLDGGRVLATAQAEAGRPVTIPLPGFTPWSPDNPHLYDLEAEFSADRVTSYFGMRKYSIGKDKNGILRFFLNNEPFFFNGVLDQGYWPESLLTPPSDEALEYDILRLKDLGFNTIRKHIKIESERFYYHCDRIGMAVWQDMPNGGGDYNMFFVTYLTNAFDWFARGVRDHHYGIFKRDDPEGRRQYYRDLRGMIRQLYNYPCIAVWVPFNEGWGQFDANKATRYIRQWDPSRLVNEACGWFDQKGGDMYSIHNYLRRLKVTPQKDRVVALTEYGGYAYPIEGHMACDREFGYRHYGSKAELSENYARLWERDIFPNVENGLCSAIYTQTSDIEEEINGIMTYDRDEDKLNRETVRMLNDRLYRLFERVTS